MRVDFTSRRATDCICWEYMTPRLPGLHSRAARDSEVDHPCWCGWGELERVIMCLASSGYAPLSLEESETTELILRTAKEVIASGSKGLGGLHGDRSLRLR